MHTIVETSKIPTSDKKNFTPRSIESLNINQDSITAKIRAEKFDFFTQKLENIIELSGIDNSEILTFDMALDPQSKTITLTGNTKQAVKVLSQENAISQKTYQEAVEKICETEMANMIQSIGPDKLAEICLETLQKIIDTISETNKEKTTKSMENLLEGLKNISPRNET